MARKRTCYVSCEDPARPPWIVAAVVEAWSLYHAGALALANFRRSGHILADEVVLEVEFHNPSPGDGGPTRYVRVGTIRKWLNGEEKEKAPR